MTFKELYEEIKNKGKENYEVKIWYMDRVGGIVEDDPKVDYDEDRKVVVI